MFNGDCEIWMPAESNPDVSADLPAGSRKSQSKARSQKEEIACHVF